MPTEKLREYNTKFQRNRRNATPEAREEYNRQQREWRTNNPDKVKQYEENRINKKVMQYLSEPEKLKQLKLQVSCEQGQQLELEI